MHASIILFSVAILGHGKMAQRDSREVICKFNEYCSDHANKNSGMAELESPLCVITRLLLAVRPIRTEAPSFGISQSSRVLSPRSETYDFSRAGNVIKELGLRSLGGTPGRKKETSILKDKILDALAPYGDPALNVPSSVIADLDALAQELEACEPRGRSQSERIAAADGRWRVRWSDAPPPSNGAIGPIRGEAYQIVDGAGGTYTNELNLFGGSVSLSLAASFTPSGDAALRVKFRELQTSVFGVPLPVIKFPEGTERTWLLTYSDENTRLVRAGVDGGRSTARELGLLAEDEGEAADSYLFILTRAIKAPLPADDNLRQELKTQLLAACEAENLGSATSADSRVEIEALMERLAALNPSVDPASSALLCGRFDIVWTTESELLFFTDNGFFGLPCKSASQIIRPKDETSGDLELQNIIDFDDGFLSVGSTCSPASVGGRVNFRFEKCQAKWRKVEVPLPPVGSGWFDILYLDKDLRLCRDVRGDLQICKRSFL